MTEHRFKSGRILTADEWQQWRNDGLSTVQIAQILGITPNYAYVIARKFTAAGYQDPVRWRRKLGPSQHIDTKTDLGAYLLGILWGTMSVSKEGYLVTHRDTFFIETIKNHLRLSAKGFRTRDGAQLRLKISTKRDIATIENMILPHGWKPRKKKERPYPSGSIDDRGFVRAWVELHSTADFRSTGRKGYSRQHRLRVYGNWALLEKMNLVISSATGLAPRRLQPTTTEITKVIYYHGSSVATVVYWLYDGADLWNPLARQRLEFADCPFEDNCLPQNNILK
jgi:hypothetical protein